MRGARYREDCGCAGKVAHQPLGEQLARWRPKQGRTPYRDPLELYELAVGELERCLTLEPEEKQALDRAMQKQSHEPASLAR